MGWTFILSSSQQLKKLVLYSIGILSSIQCVDTVGWMAGQHPVTCKNLHPVILQLFHGVRWVMTDEEGHPQLSSGHPANVENSH